MGRRRPENLSRASRSTGRMVRQFFKALASPRGDQPSTGAFFRAQCAVDLCHALLSDRGEMSGTRLASDALDAYKALPSNALEIFLDRLVDDFAPDPQRLVVALEAYRAQPSPVRLAGVQAAVESPRQELFRRLNLAPGGTSVLINLRHQVLQTLKAHPARSVLDLDLLHLFRSWFNRSLLVLRQVDWRCSAAVLEKLIQYERVHQIRDWQDLRRRLQADRRCYALFHPSLDDPLIFIEVALTKGITGKVQPLLAADSTVSDPQQANSAIFYSITNCQPGLRGISLGSLLIKQVVEEIGHDLPRIRTFASLSPIPGFCRWLRSEDARGRSSTELRTHLRTLDEPDAKVVGAPRESLKPEILRLCAFYLLRAKWGRAPLDPVARFHLANGARAERLNWMADTSEEGLRQSIGVMVNYLYVLADVERNHEAFARRHEAIASRELHRLADASQTVVSNAPPGGGMARTA
jgi:malonyl-CoA decarboxylase